MSSCKHYLRLCLLLCLAVISLVSCDLLPSVSINGTPIPSSPTNVAGTQGTPQLNTWYKDKGTPGVEVRYEDWKSPGNNEDTVTIVRFDLRYVKLSVAYQPSNPLLLSEWMQKEHATAIINGGYFDDQNNATALVVSNGQVFGTSYNGFGGMLSVDANGHTSLRSLNQQPYDPNNDQLQQATQSSPMLILNGKATQFDANAASSRRTVVAMDRQGRLLFIVSPNMAFSLGELADLLASSDLSIDRALNLDGGASTGLYLNAGSQQASIDSIGKLPIVVLVQKK
ncbi:MAG TPA: phosphodiester glycosidase family protein [Ktedonobacteraceae bacterium]|nr:phosphodiester glycosidase family protein [Ktedonobacteraceae bacterium]